MSISHPAADKSGLYFYLITKLSVMKNKVVLITGTNSGFGWLTATSCAALGHKVYATMRDTKGRNAEKAKALTRQANIEVLDVELTSGKSVNDAIATIIKKEARLDVVVNNAGIYAVGIAETFTEEDLAKVMDVNVQGPWRIIRAALPQMRKQGEGLIISGYGDLARVPAQIGAVIGQMFEALKPNPQLIADAIVNLMDTPIGKRPLRTVVDPATGGFSEKANQQVKEQYENLLTAFGMGSMLN